MLTLSQKLKTIRQSSGLSQLEVANRVNLSVSMISNYETGVKTPSLASFYALCKLYNCSSDFLLDLSNEETIYLSGLTEKEKDILYGMRQVFQENIP